LDKPKLKLLKQPNFIDLYDKLKYIQINNMMGKSYNGTIYQYCIPGKLKTICQKAVRFTAFIQKTLPSNAADNLT
jgi:hypothetical protein